MIDERGRFEVRARTRQARNRRPRIAIGVIDVDDVEIDGIGVVTDLTADRVEAATDDRAREMPARHRERRARLPRRPTVDGERPMLADRRIAVDESADIVQRPPDEGQRPRGDGLR